LTPSRSCAEAESWEFRVEVRVINEGSVSTPTIFVRIVREKMAAALLTIIDKRICISGVGWDRERFVFAIAIEHNMSG